LVPQAETLQDFIRRYSYDVPNDIKRLVAVQVIEALCYLHSMGVAHRDIKTDNVILGSGSVLKLIDFGFATTVVRG
jgi:serine/threonine protein kinase